MKVKELQSLIRESVKKTLTTKYQHLAENLSDQNNDDFSAGFDVGPKVKQAVKLAVQCAGVLTGVTPRPQGETGSVLGRCFDQILDLFVEPSGEPVYPVDSQDLKHELLDQLSREIQDLNSKVGKAASIILDKAVDKIDVHMNEAMFAEALKHLEEAGYDQYGEHTEVPTDPNWFDTLSGTDTSNPQPRKGDPEVRKYIDRFKEVLKQYKKHNRARLDNYVFNTLIDDFVEDNMISHDSAWEIAHMALEELQDEKLLESPPSGWHGTVAAMKQHGHTGKGKITNPYALAHSMKNKGYEPHYKEQPSSKRGRPVKKKGK